MPRKTILASLIISSLALTACDSDTEVLDVKENKLYTSSRIQFDPSNGVVSLPNDLLFSGTTDGTLQLPDELKAIASASAAGTTMTYDDNTYAIGALDGWSTTQPISIGVDLYENRTLDAASIEQAGAVRIIPVMLGGPISLSSDASCKGAPSLSVCGVTGAELTYGVDFITAANDKSIVVVPLKPFAENASYMYLTTNLIKDSEDESINGSVTYQLLKKDYAESPIGDPSDPADASAIGLQKLINHYDSNIITAVGIDASTVTHTGVFTTQSETDVMNILKKAMLGIPGYGPGVIGSISTDVTPVGYDLLTTTIELPYYLDTTSISSYWKAYGDSPVSILLALGDGKISPTNLITSCDKVTSVDDVMTIAANADKLVGCTVSKDLDGDKETDKYNHLTRFNPLVSPGSMQTVNVQITIPKGVRSTSGYPVNISLHGLGTLKETTLATAAAFAAQGIATIAIDMPLHGSRSFGYADGAFGISATSPQFGAPFAKGSPLNFINIASGLTVRDNFRQATADLLALRLKIGLGGFIDEGNPLFKAGEVSMHGLSLGAIVGTSFAAYANDDTPAIDLNNDGTLNSLKSFFKLETVSLVAPTGGLASVFNDSPTFGPELTNELVKTVVEAQSIAAGATEAEAEINANNVVTYKDNATAAEYAAAKKYAEAEIVPSLLFSVQTLVDPIDPINMAKNLAANTPKLHVIQVVGDRINNKPDQVLPNGNGLTLTGTQTLINLLKIGCVDTDGSTKGAVNFSKGHHSSLIQASGAGATFSGVTDEDALAATTEMQMQVSEFAGTGTIPVTNNSVISPCS